MKIPELLPLKMYEFKLTYSESRVGVEMCLNAAMWFCMKLSRLIIILVSSVFLCPRDDSQGALRFAPVCLSVCPSVRSSVRPFVTLYGIEFV